MERVKAELPGVVRHVIASEWLRAEAVSPALGSVTLRPHQLDAARRLRALLARRGGALLCDEVGLGKTYVALAVARSHARPLVVAPASLRDMWQAAAARSGVAICFASTESLSRTVPPQRDHDLVIVDEAHHFRTSSTARHGSLAALVARTPILLVSATPVHNERADMTALLSLFLGSAVRGLSDAQIAQHVVRRNQADVAGAFPRVRGPVHLSIPHDTRQVELLLALPAPAPARGGGIAAAMIAHTLVRLWASSDAALREGLRRRLAKTVAIRGALEAGHYPTAEELRAWTYGEGSVQLGFAAILSPERHEHCDGLLDAARSHEHALVELLDLLPRQSSADAARAEQLRALRFSHLRSKIVAFSQFAGTVAMYYRRLSLDHEVAMLTSRGARIASGPITRREALERFSPLATGAARSGRGQVISLLLATDLLSEGVNLQDADVVVHLDLPWTAATLEQRVGRVARLGSQHQEVFVYAMDPPAPSRQLVKAESIIRRKAGLIDAHVGASRLPPLFARLEQAPRSEIENAEELRRTVAGWCASHSPPAESRIVVAAVEADRSGLLALVTVRDRVELVAGSGGELSARFCSVRAIAESACGGPASVDATEIAAALEQVRQWIDTRLAADDAGQLQLGQSVLARRLGARLAHCLASCPLHQRPSCSARIATLQSRLQSPFTLGVEREIEDLMQRERRVQDFLVELEQIIGPAFLEPGDSRSRIHAVLILTQGGGSKR